MQGKPWQHDQESHDRGHLNNDERLDICSHAWMSARVPSQVFISHSSSDAVWVDWIAVQARTLGVEPYLAQHDPNPGTVLSTKVREAIRASDAVVVLLTTSSINSPYVHQEVGVAIEQGKLVVPVVDPALAGTSLAMLDGLEYIAFDFAAPAAGTSALVAQLQEIGTLATRRDAAAQLHDLATALLVAAAVLALVVVATQQNE